MATQYFLDAEHGPHRAIFDFGFATPGTLFGHGKSSVTGFAPYTFDRSSGSWVAAFVPSYSGEVDWHGGGETIRWVGPRARYWYVTGDGYGFAIARGTGVWCRTLTSENVAGAAILSHLGKKYLTAVVRGATTIDVYQREFAETYADDLAYHVDDNPLGWKLLGSSTDGSALIVQPCYFNSSGTEGQLLWRNNGTGVEKRIKISVGFESVVFQDIFDVIGSYTHHGVLGDTISTDYTDLVPAIFAVDYVGDTEVIAYVQRTRADSQTPVGSGSSCSAVLKDEGLPTEHWDYTETRIGRHTTSNEVVVTYGDREFKCYEQAGSGTENWFATHIGFEAAGSVSYSASFTDTEIKRKLIYLDMRTDTLIYTRNEIVANTSSSWAEVPFEGETGTLSSTTNYTHTHKQYIDQGGTIITINDPAETADQVDTEGGFSITLSHPCPVSQAQQLTDIPITYNYATNYTNDILNLSAASGAGAVGCTEDSARNMLCSVSIWTQATRTGGGGEAGKFNYLTGGDPVAVSGLPGSDPWFDNVALIKW